MKIVLLGSGNVATHLAQALVAKGEEMVQVFSQSLRNAISLTGLVGGEPVDDLTQVK